MKIPLILLLPVLVLAARADTPAVALAADQERIIESSGLTGDAPAVAAATAALDAALGKEPNQPALLYERAYADYTTALLLRRGNDKAALLAAYTRACDRLEKVRGQPWEAEAQGLHGNILGSMIELKGGMAGMVLGPKSGQLLGRAQRTLPDSPRVLLFRGTSLLFTPAAFGGDPEEGAKVIATAVAKFAAAATPAPGAPQWGHAEALAWLGLAKQKVGDLNGARAAWEQALALAPDYAWVKFALLPSLAQKAAP